MHINATAPYSIASTHIQPKYFSHAATDSRQQGADNFNARMRWVRMRLHQRKLCAPPVHRMARRCAGAGAAAVSSVFSATDDLPPMAVMRDARARLLGECAPLTASHRTAFACDRI